jgi:uncharacterized coiled-coil DUF342 family protein
MAELTENEPLLNNLDLQKTLIQVRLSGLVAHLDQLNLEFKQRKDERSRLILKASDKEYAVHVYAGLLSESNSPRKPTYESKLEKMKEALMVIRAERDEANKLFDEINQKLAVVNEKISEQVALLSSLCERMTEVSESQLSIYCAHSAPSA